MGAQFHRRPGAMTMDRRRFLILGTAAAATVSPAVAAPSPIGALGVDGAQFGLRPGSTDDQSRAFQRAIDETARNRTPLAIAPGSYRVGNLRLPANAQLVGVRGATQAHPQRQRVAHQRDRRGARHAVGPRARRPAPPPARAARPRAFRERPPHQDRRLRNPRRRRHRHRLHRGRRRDRRHASDRQRRRRDPFLRCPRAR